MENQSQVNFDEFVTEKGRRRTASLFYETAYIKGRNYSYSAPPVYTLKERPVVDRHTGKTLPSARAIYVMANSDYEAAMKLFGSWSYWEIFLKLKWFNQGKPGQFEGLIQWRRERAARQQAEAETTIANNVREGNLAAANAQYKNVQEEARKGGPKAAEKTRQKAREIAEQKPLKSNELDRITSFRKKA